MIANFLRSSPQRLFWLCGAALASGCSSGSLDSSEITATPVHIAPATPVALPPPTPPEEFSIGMAQVVKLARAGVSEQVLSAFIVRSTETYQPTADELVLLHDLGVTETVVAMLFHPPGARFLPDSPQSPAASAPLVATQPPPQPLSNPAPVAVEPPAPEAIAPPQTIQAAVPVTTVVQQTVVVSAPETVLMLPEQDLTVVRYFWPSLEPYGSWVKLSSYGWCWQPTVAVGNPQWRPYADRGRWVYSDHGWYWLSDYSWGWAPFHYGRWFMDSSQGWCWVPDGIWSPAWVSWRQANDHCGWAPLPPLGRHLSRSPHLAHDFGLHATHYTFLPLHRLCEPSPLAHRVSGTQFNFIFGRSTVINKFNSRGGDIVFNSGPGRDRYAAAAGKPVTTVNVRPLSGNTRPDQLHRSGESLLVYRPQLSQLPLIPSAAEIDRSRNETRKPEFGVAKRNATPSQTTLPGAGGARTAGGNSPARPAAGTTLPQALSQPSAVTAPATTMQGVASSQSGVPIYSVNQPEHSQPSRREPAKPVGGSNRSTRPARTGIQSIVPEPGVEMLSPPQPITSVPQPLGVDARPLTPPQPITSVPQALGVNTRRLTPPRPITSVPQPLGVDVRPLTPPQPVTMPPASNFESATRQVREAGRYEPSRQLQTPPPQETPRWEQPVRREFQPQQQSTPWERNVTRQLQSQFPQPAPSQFPQPSRPSFPQPAAPAVAPPARPAAPAVSAPPPARSNPGNSGSPSKRNEPRR